ncbi:MAG: ABC transporter permease [Defluviitaleaceae bacterium]|nr:ABC transporter permease [Defluviitaleaceae bacterium]
MMITKHYFKRLLVEPIGLAINVFFPVLLVFINVTVNVNAMEGGDTLFSGYSVTATSIATLIMVMFQFMYGTHMVDLFFRDFKNSRRWRLLAAPASLSKYLFSIMMASVFFSVLTGVLIMAVAAIALNAHVHNPFVLLTVIVIIAVFSQVFGMLVSLLIRKKGVAEAVCVLFSFFMIVPSGDFLVTININIHALNVFFNYMTPYAQAMRAIMASGIMGNSVSDNFGGALQYMGRDMSTALLNMGTLTATTILLAIIVVIVSRRRSF